MPAEIELDITVADGRSVLWLHSSKLEEGLLAYRKGKFSALGINASRGYHADNIEFLREHPYVDNLHIVPGAFQFDLKPIQALTNLRSLVLNGSSVGTALCEFPSLEEFRGYWHPGLLGEHPTLRLLDLSEFQASNGNLSGIPGALPALEELVLVQPRKLESLMTISRFEGLRTVEVAHAKSLLSLRDLDALPYLASLKCDSCRSVADAEEVLVRLQLRVLRLNKFAALSSLKFLDSLAELEEFRFVDTDVADGDLRPLLRLRRVGFLPKKHFSHRPEEIEQAIGQKWGQS